MILLGEIYPSSMMIDSNSVIKQFKSLSERIKIRMNSTRPTGYIKINKIDPTANLQEIFCNLQEILAIDFPNDSFKIWYEHIPNLFDVEKMRMIRKESVSITIFWD